MTDRTEDFRLIAAALPPPSRTPPPPPKAAHGDKAAPSGSVAQQVSTLGDFHSAAASIAKKIHVVSQKLGRLTKLVQQRGLFNDPASEINSLVHSIKQDMQDLNAQLDATQKYVDRKKAEKGARNQAANHSVHVVGQLKSELMNTARVFKDVLQQRSTNLKAQKDHKDKFFSSQSPTLTLARPPAYRSLGISPVKSPTDTTENGGYSGANRNGGAAAGNGQGLGVRTSLEGGAPSPSPSPLPRPEDVTSLPEAEQEASADTPLIAPTTMQSQRHQQAQMQLQAGNESYLESRSTAVQEVEGHIAELGLIFNKLATMLQDQREMVESIHDNVEDAGENVGQGHLALVGTLQALNSNRRLTLTVFGILFLFIVFFFVFLL